MRGPALLLLVVVTLVGAAPQVSEDAVNDLPKFSKVADGDSTKTSDDLTDVASQIGEDAVPESPKVSKVAVDDSMMTTDKVSDGAPKAFEEADGSPSSDKAPLRFDGHQVLQAVPSSLQQLQEVRDLFRKHEQLDVWKGPTAVGEAVHFRVSPAERAEIKSELDSLGIKYEVFIPDVQELVDKERSLPRIGGFWQSYHRVDNIYAWMADLARQHPGVATYVRGGRSAEGRSIDGVRIAHQAGLPVVYLEGGIHAREWISPAAATFILHQLLTSDNATVQRVARSFEWHIFPVVNPDGYEYSHTTDRLWRKTRSRTSIYCFGADPNRNWQTAWAQTGVSFNPCSETFPGVKAESELETVTRLRYMEPLMDRMKVFIALHSYGQYLLFPWGHTHAKAPTHTDMLSIGQTAAKAIYERYGTSFRVGNLADTLYSAAGSSMDWAYAHGARMSYTMELRDSGRYGFMLPPDQIVYGAEEALDGVLAIATESLRRL